MKLEHYFAQTGVDPLTSAFSNEASPHAMPPMGRGKPAPWEGGCFEDFAAESYLQTAERPLSLYLHTPFCHHRCTFCPFYANLTRPGFSSEYAPLVSEDIAHTAEVLGDGLSQRTIDAIYFGGGTPSDLDRDDLAQLIRQLRATFPVRQDTEITVEGRITGFSKDKGQAWVDAGANRFSLGVQTADSKLRRKLGRLAERDEIRTVLNDLCDTGAIVIVDLIFGFPGQTIEMLLEDIRFLSEETGIDGLDLYELRMFPDSPLDKAIKRGKMGQPPSRGEMAKMYGAASDRLAHFGFEHFTLKHWRRRTEERSVYNRIAGAQSDMLPFGSGGGGRLGHISLGTQSDLAKYTEMVLRGEKPLGRISAMPQHNGLTFEQLLSNALNDRRLPPLTQWPSHTRTQGALLLTQWKEAGLLAANDDERGIQLSCAGSFWAMRLRSLLLAFTAEAAA